MDSKKAFATGLFALCSANSVCAQTDAATSQSDNSKLGKALSTAGSVMGIVSSFTGQPAQQSAPAAQQPNMAMPQGMGQQPMSLAAALGSLNPGAGVGSLKAGNMDVSPMGCLHNGDHAVCSFHATNRGGAAGSVYSGDSIGNRFGNSYTARKVLLSTVRFIDDASVPHATDHSYFLDGYGNQQPEVFLQPGATALYVMEFPNVYPQVSSGAFQLDNQTVGRVSVRGGGPQVAAPQPIYPQQSAPQPYQQQAPAAPGYTAQPQQQPNYGGQPTYGGQAAYAQQPQQPYATQAPAQQQPSTIERVGQAMDAATKAKAVWDMLNKKPSPGEQSTAAAGTATP